MVPTQTGLVSPRNLLEIQIRGSYSTYTVIRNSGAGARESVFLNPPGDSHSCWSLRITSHQYVLAKSFMISDDWVFPMSVMVCHWGWIGSTNACLKAVDKQAICGC